MEAIICLFSQKSVNGKNVLITYEIHFNLRKEMCRNTKNTENQKVNI